MKGKDMWPGEIAKILFWVICDSVVDRIGPVEKDTGLWAKDRSDLRTLCFLWKLWTHTWTSCKVWISKLNSERNRLAFCARLAPCEWNRQREAPVMQGQLSPSGVFVACKNHMKSSFRCKILQAHTCFWNPTQPRQVGVQFQLKMCVKNSPWQLLLNSFGNKLESAEVSSALLCQSNGKIVERSTKRRSSRRNYCADKLGNAFQTEG